MLRFIIAVALGCAILLPVAHAHSGGTDSKGCHYNRKTGEYHCHGRK